MNEKLKNVILYGAIAVLLIVVIAVLYSWGQDGKEEETTAPQESVSEPVSDQVSESESETEPEDKSGFQYTLNESGTAYILTGFGEELSGEMEVPNYYNLLPVTAIDAYALRDCTGLTGISIGNNVESIGEGAFVGCYNLESIMIGEGIRSIGSGAFEGCSALKTVNITDIASWCMIDFDGESANPLCVADSFCLNYMPVQQIAIPDAITEIKDYTFYNLSSLEGLTLNDKITTVGEKAFYQCSSLLSVTVGNGVKTIGEDAFAGCDKLDRVYTNDLTAWCGISFENVNSNPLYFAGSLYESGTMVSTLVIPASVSTILPYTFSGCKDIKAIMLGDSVQTISSYAFANCSSLTTITAGGSLKKIESNAFRNCGNGEIKLNYRGTAEQWSKVSCASGWGSGSNIKLNPLTAEGSDGLKYVKNDDETSYTLVGIGTCKDTEIVIPSVYEGYPVTAIGENAFAKNKSVKRIEIPDSITSIGESAFANCTALTSISIPSNIEAIGLNAFYGCTKLQTETYDNATYLGNEENPYVVLLAAVNSDIASCTIHEDTAVIASKAFMTCKNLTAIEFPAGLKCIGNNAFGNCTALSKLVFPNGLKTIGNAAFYFCTGLITVTVEGSIDSVGEDAFAYCFRIYEIINHSTDTITVGDIGYGHLAQYAIEVHSDAETRIVNENDLLFYKKGNDRYLIGYVGTETEITLPRGFDRDVYSIYQYAFYNCKTLESIYISDGVTAIGAEAFAGCTALYDVTVNVKVAYIGENVFRDCSSLTALKYKDTIAAWNLIFIHENAFSSSSITTVECTDGKQTIG